MGRALLIAGGLVLLAGASCSGSDNGVETPTGGGTQEPESSPTVIPPTCVDDDAATYPPEIEGHPVIDRLADGESYEELLAGFIEDNCLRMNHIQVVGTHNSYHLEPREDVLNAIGGQMPDVAASMQYAREALGGQLSSMGVRQLELDVYADPEGGLYADPVGPRILGAPDPQEGMDQPGLKVLHIQDIDYRTTCKTFVACLEEVRAWSDQNPGHLPLLILVEAKDVPLVTEGVPATWTVPVPFDAVQLGRIDEEIRSVFGEDRLITPDDVRGGRATLNEAILKDGWPTLREARGRVFFALDNEDTKRDAYVAGHASLAGRVMFTSSPAGTPESAFIKMNEPLADGALAKIQGLVEAGYIVRTRADAETLEARQNVTQRRDAAFASGAQFISTDYPVADVRFSDYRVVITGGSIALCNPGFAPGGCVAAALEAGH